MIGRYAYSVHGEKFVGAYPTRDEAVERAFEVARMLPTPPSSVFVGKRVAGDPQAKNLARNVLRLMRERALSAVGDEAEGYLAGVTKEQETDLDQSLAATVVDWLERHELAPTFFKIEAVSEHPVPQARRNGNWKEEKEVQYLGQAPWGL
jgi:hypothetical protein